MHLVDFRSSSATYYGQSLYVSPKTSPVRLIFLLLVFRLIRYSNLGLSPSFRRLAHFRPHFFLRFLGSRLPFVVPPYYYFLRDV
jgi:hypothetical protein